MLCPVSKIFGAKELQSLGETVRIGFANEEISFQVGTVTFFLKQIDGKFPRLDRFLDGVSKLTYLTLDARDADFIRDRLENMPGLSDSDKPVYVELNERVAVRGHDTTTNICTELQLVQSKYDGRDTTYATNRDYLKNAIDFGVHRIGFDTTEQSPIIGESGNKTYIWMPLETDEPKIDSKMLTVLASNKTSSPSRNINQAQFGTKIERPTNIVSKDEPKPAVESVNVIQTAEALCVSLQETLQNTRRLVKHLKQQRKQDRIVRSTLESLKQLQGL